MSLINGVTCLSPEPAVHYAPSVDVCRCFKIVTHQSITADKVYVCDLCSKTWRLCDSVGGLIILFVALPTACLPADPNAGLFMK